MQTTDAHILFIDDHPSVLKVARMWLSEEYGYTRLETASSSQDAFEKLAEPFDIIISDMRMEENDSGFKVLDCVQERNLSSVVIIFTANDTVIDCRSAFKSRAWDYIAKNKHDKPFEVLNASIQDAIAYFNRWGNTLNEQWFDEHQDELEDEYWGKYIAIVNQQILDNDASEADLLQRLDERQLRRFTTTIRKVGDLPPIAHLLTQDEGQTLEFKSTLRWSVRGDRQDDKLQHSVLKTIAGFLNAKGGTLLIGVDDDRQIFGLEKDYALLKKSSRDGFELHLRNLIDSQLGKQFLTYLQFRFEAIKCGDDHRDVCAIYVRASARVAFLKSQTADRAVELHIRIGNETRVQTIPEIYDRLQSLNTSSNAHSMFSSQNIQT